MPPSDTEKPTEQINIVGIALTLLVLIVIAFFVDLDSVKIWVEKAGIWGPLVFILLKTSTLVVAPLSGSPLYPLVGVLFGFWPGFLYVLLGDFFGYTICFFISRMFGKKIVAKFISDKEEGFLTRVVDHASTPKGFFHACLTLVAMPELLAYGAGLTRLPYLNFITTIVPITAVGSGLFVFIGSILDPGNQSILIGFGLPAVGVLAMLIGGFLFSKKVIRG
mgnify:CR=1 FL=1